MPADAKPAKGTAKQARKTKRSQVEAGEREQKHLVRMRDLRCRYPLHAAGGCVGPLEVAHITAKGMGGDHGTRSTTANMVLVCAGVHRGSVSMHSGGVKVEALSDAGADGPLRWRIVADREHGIWEERAWPRD